MAKKQGQTARSSGNRRSFIVDGFSYHNSVTRNKRAIRYLLCAQHKKFGCPGRANIPLYGDKKQIQVTRAHNHPPDQYAEERTLFIAQLKAAVESLPGRLKDIYTSVAQIYPRGSFDLPFEQVHSSMNRWRRRAQ